MNYEVHSEDDMKALGLMIGEKLVGGEVIELRGDVGAGKTTIAKGIAAGLGVTETVQSPSFTISRVYDARGSLQLAHYDFYRLNDPGIMRDELAETEHNTQVVTMIEWADVVRDVLPAQRGRIVITSPTETTRLVTIEGLAV